MTKILFVCLGNICRSPMAEFVMKDLVKKAGLASQFHIESAATSREEIGNPVYQMCIRDSSTTAQSICIKDSYSQDVNMSCG